MFELFRPMKNESGQIGVYHGQRGDWELFVTQAESGHRFSAYLGGILHPTSVFHTEVCSDEEFRRLMEFHDSLPFNGACCPKAKLTPCVCRMSFVCPEHAPHGRCHGSHD